MIIKNKILYFRNILKKEKWQNISIYKKKKLTLDIFKYLSKELENNVKKIIFYTDSEEYNKKYANGYFDNNNLCIYINEKMLFNDNGYLLYNLIAHELFHSYQNSKGLKEYKEILEIVKDKKISLYIYPVSYLNTNIYVKTNIFYVLNKYEREANNYGDNQERLLNKNVFKIDINISNFKDIYNCSHLKDKEIFKLIDDCFSNIYHNINPSNNLEATIMYDIYVLAMYNSNIIDNIKLINLLKNKNKAQLLEKEGYEIFGDEPSNSLAENCKDIRNNKENSLKLLKSLNLIQLKNNPDFINTMLFYYNKDTLKILKDKNYNIYKINKEINYELDN